MRIKPSSPLLSAYHTLSAFTKSLVSQVIEFALVASAPKTHTYQLVRIPVKRAHHARHPRGF
jgi:hypothetical protein